LAQVIAQILQPAHRRLVPILRLSLFFFVVGHKFIG
jgi:hypothetical protein